MIDTIYYWTIELTKLLLVITGSIWWIAYIWERAGVWKEEDLRQNQQEGRNGISK